MTHAEFATYFNYVTDQLGIKIYPVTTTQFNTVKIAINKKGIESVGETYYSQTPKGTNPKYWVVIEQLYKQYYTINSKRIPIKIFQQVI